MLKIFRMKRLAPNFKKLGMEYEDSVRITEAKSPWMVMYLRARREKDPLISFFRKSHFERKALLA